MNQTDFEHALNLLQRSNYINEGIEQKQKRRKKIEWNREELKFTSQSNKFRLFEVSQNVNESLQVFIKFLAHFSTSQIVCFV